MTETHAETIPANNFPPNSNRLRIIPANTRKVAIGSSNLWIIAIVAVFNEQLYK